MPRYSCAACSDDAILNRSALIVVSRLVMKYVIPCAVRRSMTLAIRRAAGLTTTRGDMPGAPGVPGIGAVPRGARRGRRAGCSRNHVGPGARLVSVVSTVP